MDMKILNDFIRADDLLIAMKVALDEMKKQRSIAHDELLGEFEQEGVKVMENDAGRKVKKSQKISVSPTVDREDVCKVLKKHGLKTFVDVVENYDTKKLNAYFSEAAENEVELPEELKDCIKKFEYSSIKVSRPKKKKPVPV